MTPLACVIMSPGLEPGVIITGRPHAAARAGFMPTVAAAAIDFLRSRPRFDGAKWALVVRRRSLKTGAHISYEQRDPHGEIWELCGTNRMSALSFLPPSEVRKAQARRRRNLPLLVAFYSPSMKWGFALHPNRGEAERLALVRSWDRPLQELPPLPTASTAPAVERRGARNHSGSIEETLLLLSRLPLREVKDPMRSILLVRYQERAAGVIAAESFHQHPREPGETLCAAFNGKAFGRRLDMIDDEDEVMLAVDRFLLRCASGGLS